MADNFLTSWATISFSRMGPAWTYTYTEDWAKVHRNSNWYWIPLYIQWQISLYININALHKIFETSDRIRKVLHQLAEASLSWLKILWFTALFTGKRRGSTLKQAMITSFPVSINS